MKLILIHQTLCVVTDGTLDLFDVNVGLITVLEKAFGHPFLALHYNEHQQVLGMKISKLEEMRKLPQK